MAEMLLLNPRRRKARRASPAKRRPAARRRRRNPLPVAAPTPNRRSGMSISGRRRRRNPIANLKRHMKRRRRNPIKMGSLNVKSLVAMLKDGAIGGAGGVAMDLIMGQLNTYLPITFQTVPGLPGVGDAVKAGITAVLGEGAARMTKGLSRKMAQGALAVQAHQILSGMLPASMAVGYYSPARVVPGTNRIGPIRQGVNRYTRPGTPTPLLQGMGAYMAPGASQLLSRAGSAREREGYKYR